MELSEAVVQHGTRHVRADERGWLWLTHRGVMVHDGQEWQSLFRFFAGY